MNVCTCPEREQLRDYVLGKLDAVHHQAIEEHLDECSSCEQLVERLEGSSDAVLEHLHQPRTPVPSFDDSALRQLVAQVRTLAVQPVPSSAIPELSQYKLLEPIGAGGMGQVFKAEHRHMKRLVAVKFLAPELLPSTAARARFQREIETVARLTHPNIVTAHDAGEEEGRAFLVMEYVEGQNLADLVKEQGPLSIEHALKYILDAARGLAHAHAAGIVHRDVKPANLLLASGGGQPPEGPVKILDLGLARLHLPAREEGSPDLTGAGLVMGTATYMAPEQATNPHSADPRADIYSLGCCLYYLLAGHPPYAGQTTLDILLAHREQPIPSLVEARDDCPVAVDALFRKMVAKRPEDRPATMNAVIVALEHLLTNVVKARKENRGLVWLGVMGVALAASVLLGLVVFRLVQGEMASLTEQARQEKERALPEAVPGPGNRVKAPLLEMVPIPAGEFKMGSSDTDLDASSSEKPLHTVKITQPFFLGKFEVTQAQYEEVMGTNPSAYSPKGRFKNQVKGIDTSQYPVESISWFDAVRFCNRLSERHNLKPYYKIAEDKTVTIAGGDGYRLPTEAEWEYACRAGSDKRWSFGESASKLGDYAWFADNSGDKTHPVGKKKANPFGLYDMHGNVPEWCWDRYDANYYKKSPTSNPPGSGQGKERVYRGGAWNSLAAQTRSAARDSVGSTYSVLTIVGLRVARNVEN
jgi:formylglycine-generating enzyme required for sulfatase activity/tRNA A-37 threonylcarbamoyl transferase component Bud32